MKTTEQKANAAYRRAAKRAARSGKSVDEYRARRQALASARALYAEQTTTTEQ